eukprot:CAMPEP_0115004856 /NCGR_PEP_ID=MMETSP0216-20121206/19499_1 /TAXON_ID=223996 /ORGANISM="Protocruzia adherens, Strain Boccale" /LENGTH=54 /DNA_ID=CAMNT_0002371019 /DNA_START=108 /DNA_END=269 /DNA_ORIENTATION=-
MNDPVAAWIATAEMYKNDDSWKLNARRASQSSDSSCASSSSPSSISTDEDLYTP